MKREENATKLYRPGNVFQINEAHGRKGWIGVFILATEIKPWGIQGFASVIHTEPTQEQK